MSLNTTPSGERTHIGLFGKRNAGKSSLINALTNQSLAIVSDHKGTTTDPVSKAMELLPLGPVVLIDTPGIDDEGELGAQRIAKTQQVLAKCDIALLVVDAQTGLTTEDTALWNKITARKLPALLVLNKMELLSEMQQALVTVSAMKLTKDCIFVSAVQSTNINELKEKIASFTPHEKPRCLISDLVNPGDTVILVTPIDESAPKGRMILPQQQVLRDALDSHALTLVVQPSQLPQAIAQLAAPPALIVTDSQAFGEVSRIVPPSLPLTSFSILMARYKGALENAVRAAQVLDSITAQDKILISEGCTHHRQCQDIGTVKLPGWVRDYTGTEPQFVFTSGTEFPADLSDYKLVIHCGACMLNEKEMQHRGSVAKAQNIPMTNYGIAIAYMHGILKRTTAMLPEIKSILQ